MKVTRLIGVFVGLGILLFGILLVSTHGYLGGTYLPSIIGIQPCTSSTPQNLSSCGGIDPFAAYGVGTIVCIFGLGILASSFRRAVSSPGSSGGMPPEVLAALAQTRTTPTSAAPGARAGTVYCSRCGAANPTEAKFCHQCAAPMPAAAGASPAPPAT